MACSKLAEGNNLANKQNPLFEEQRRPFSSTRPISLSSPNWLSQRGSKQFRCIFFARQYPSCWQYCIQLQTWVLLSHFHSTSLQLNINFNLAVASRAFCPNLCLGRDWDKDFLPFNIRQICPKLPASEQNNWNNFAWQISFPSSEQILVCVTLPQRAGWGAGGYKLFTIYNISFGNWPHQFSISHNCNPVQAQIEPLKWKADG